MGRYGDLADLAEAPGSSRVVIRAETVRQRIERETAAQAAEDQARLEEQRARIALARKVADERAAKRAEVRAQMAALDAELEALRTDPGAANRRSVRAWLDSPEREDIQAAFDRLTPDPPDVTRRRRYDLYMAATAAERRTA